MSRLGWETRKANMAAHTTERRYTPGAWVLHTPYADTEFASRRELISRMREFNGQRFIRITCPDGTIFAGTVAGYLESSSPREDAA